MDMNQTAMLEVGAWLGRHQVYGVIGSKCSAGDAHCLREIRDNKHYKALGITWEEFCNRHAGVDRKTAESIIERLDEFGEAYFNLSQLVPIQPSGYRLLASNVTGNTLDLDGEKIPITPENADRVIHAVHELRSRLEQEQSKGKLPFESLQSRLDRCFSELTGAVRRSETESDRALLIALLDDAINRFEEAQRSVAMRH